MVMETKTKLRKGQEAILDKAIELISPEGAWGKGDDITPPDDCLCLLTALSKAESMCGLGAFSKAGHAVEELLASECGDSKLYGWNDHPDRTQQEVIDLLRRVRDNLNAN